jgi:hypothetical protein
MISHIAIHWEETYYTFTYFDMPKIQGFRKTQNSWKKTRKSQKSEGKPKSLITHVFFEPLWEPPKILPQEISTSPSQTQRNHENFQKIQINLSLTF